MRMKCSIRRFWWCSAVTAAWLRTCMLLFIHKHWQTSVSYSSHPLPYSLHFSFLPACVEHVNVVVRAGSFTRVHARLSTMLRDCSILKCSHRSCTHLRPQTIQLCTAEPSFWQPQLLPDTVSPNRS